jgi:hypothetical protein
MATFAEIDENNIVVNILKVPDSQEHRGQEYLAEDLNLGGIWKQTSFNTRAGIHYDENGEPDNGIPIRMNHAMIGGHYDPEGDAFYPPQPVGHPSFILNKENLIRLGFDDDQQKVLQDFYLKRNYSPLWINDSYTLSTFFTSSTYTEYYVDVYNLNPSLTGSEVQFDLQYGHIHGSGSTPINPTVQGYSPSRVVYGQYRNLVYGTETDNFSFDGVTTAQQIYIINIARSRYKESIQPGSLNLSLRSGSATIQLTDDSNATSLTRFIGENRIFYIISGSNGTPYTAAASASYYGIMLPDLGFIVLNASGSLTPYIQAASLATSSVNNHLKLWASLVSGSNFQLRSQETVSSRFFFTRVKNSEFNYTTNPSIIDTNGNLLYTTLINNPQTFITTVGMYNDNNELLAVAKLSKPLVKDFTKEALIRIKLDY